MRKNSKVLTVLLIVIFLSSIVVFHPLPVKAQPKTIVVPDDYPDIQIAINHANSGDTVFVKAGIYVYNEQNTTLARPHSGNPDYGIMVNKSIALIGENKNTIISMNYHGGTVRAVCIVADNVTFSGFTVTSDIWSKYGGVGSLALCGSNCSITNNDFQRTLVGTGSNDTISYNNFEGADNFGLVVELYNSVISYNRIVNNYLGGIDVSDSANVIIKENEINSNGIDNYGLHPTGYAGAGISLTTYNQNLNTNISIYHNNITNNSRFGIQFNGAACNSSIFNNKITDNGVGINLGNFALRKYSPIGNGTEIFFNNIFDNTKNAYVEREYPYNLTSDMYYNHVTGNTTTVVSWDNGVVGNYWGDYNGNGFYVIDEKNIDHYPLTQQVDLNAIAPTPMASFSSRDMINLIILILGVLLFIAAGASVCMYSNNKISKQKSNNTSS